MIIHQRIIYADEVYYDLDQQFASLIWQFIKLLMTQVQRLINILHVNIMSKKDITSSLRYDKESEQHHFQQLKTQMSKHYRPAWICNIHSNLATGIAPRKEKHLALKHKQLNNWQIARISLSKRSYAYPKNYHGFKIPAVGRNFSIFSSKDAEGHLPYVYQGELKKRINKIREEMQKSTLVRTNTVKSQYFGFEKIRKNKAQTKKNQASCHSLG